MIVHFIVSKTLHPICATNFISTVILVTKDCCMKSAFEQQPSLEYANFFHTIEQLQTRLEKVYFAISQLVCVGAAETA